MCHVLHLFKNPLFPAALQVTVSSFQPKYSKRSNEIWVVDFIGGRGGDGVENILQFSNFKGEMKEKGEPRDWDAGDKHPINTGTHSHTHTCSSNSWILITSLRNWSVEKVSFWPRWSSVALVTGSNCSCRWWRCCCGCQAGVSYTLPPDGGS